MAQAGLHAIIGYHTNKIIPSEKHLMPGVVFGSMLPDIDVILVAFGSLFHDINNAEKLFHRTFTHSFFTLIFIYLLFAILSELKKKPSIKIIGKGIAIGMLTHYLTDIFLWFNSIDLLWPLPIPSINLWNLWAPSSEKLYDFLLIMEFFCFRWYAWFLIKKHYEKPNIHSWIVVYLNKWKKIESILFISFILITMISIPHFKLLFGIAYIPSLIMALFSTYLSKEALECLPA